MKISGEIYCPSCDHRMNRQIVLSECDKCKRNYIVTIEYSNDFTNTYDQVIGGEMGTKEKNICKRYKLLKNLPSIKSGTEFTKLQWDTDFYYPIVNGNAIANSKIHYYIVENNNEWFDECKYDKKEDMNINLDIVYHIYGVDTRACYGEFTNMDDVQKKIKSLIKQSIEGTNLPAEYYYEVKTIIRKAR